MSVPRGKNGYPAQDSAEVHEELSKMNEANNQKDIKTGMKPASEAQRLALGRYVESVKEQCKLIRKKHKSEGTE